MTKKVFGKDDKSVIRMTCGATFNERCFEIAERVEENRDNPCLADYVRGASLKLSWDVACSFAETYSNKMLDDVCDLLREMNFFKSDEGISEDCMEEQFRHTLLGLE